ncbi:MAG: hydroxymethylglutaryl-CoA reductase [Coxiellaceae bacterium]|jgi:hydroxymethylglutaryl-CoA reductase (NADPH)|nr:hydroxymethylglutaryl-CoA reductase [Coxiellaceae bacterium]
MQTLLPTRIVGPIKIISNDFSADSRVPLATFEKPLWFSVERGARVTRKSGGIRTVLVQDCMTRSILVEAENAIYAFEVVNSLKGFRSELEKIAVKSSRFTQLKDWQTQIVANLIYIRFTFTTGGAAGHNMSTKAAEMLQQWLLDKFPKLKYISISGNYCVDKKNSAVNGILGRGKFVIAEALIPRELCQKELKASPEKIVDLNIKKNLLGSIISGGVRTANAHFANMLLAFYLAMGQDAANIVEGSQGFTYAEVRKDDLYFSVTLPNIIIGAIGSNKDLDWVKENLRILGVLKPNDYNFNARALALIAAAVVLCGEISLMAAQTNPGELMRSHLAIERKNVIK